MNLQLYVITGKENAGKTSTCWNLLHKLKEHIDYVEYWELRSANAHLDSVRQVYINDKGKTCDFVIVFRIKNTNVKIAIISAGDEAWLLKKDIFFALSKDVAHIVCCSRSVDRQHSTMRMLKDMSKMHHYVSWPKELEFSKNISIQQKFEEKISESIYQQFKEARIL